MAGIFSNASLMKQKNTWGTSGGVEPQRSDLFRVILQLPTVLGEGAAWEKECMFAVEQFPFPAREREMIGIKYLNQTNYVPGAEAASSQIDMTVRYAFNARTAELLEKWHWATSNPKTGSVALASSIKTDGKFQWLVPDASADLSADGTGYRIGGTYILEGCLIRGLQPGAANMNEGNGLVNLTFSLQIDRYYPENPSDLYVV